MKLCALTISIIVVTPFVGVWIETVLATRTGKDALVTPFVGVWIETTFQP